MYVPEVSIFASVFQKEKNTFSSLLPSFRVLSRSSCDTNKFGRWYDGFFLQQPQHWSKIN